MTIHCLYPLRPVCWHHLELLHVFPQAALVVLLSRKNILHTCWRSVSILLGLQSHIPQHSIDGPLVGFQIPVGHLYVDLPNLLALLDLVHLEILQAILVAEAVHMV